LGNREGLPLQRFQGVMKRGPLRAPLISNRVEFLLSPVEKGAKLSFPARHSLLLQNAKKIYRSGDYCSLKLSSAQAEGEMLYFLSRVYNRDRDSPET
jgi:hypothetical protein